MRDDFQQKREKSANLIILMAKVESMEKVPDES
jgi:hypothetical protein